MMKLTNPQKQNPQLLKYFVWVGGVYNEHHTKIRAMQDYFYWLDMGYEDVIIEEKIITL